MLRIFANSIDITEDVIYGSVTIKEQLNNRSNICSFKTIDKKVNESEEVRVYECMQLTKQALSWQPTIEVDDTYEFFRVFRAGDQIIMDFEWTNELVTIQSIDHTLKTVTFTANLQNTYNKDTLVWRRIFGWSVDKNPDSQFGSSEKLEYAISCSDYSTTFNRQVVVETFQDNYMRQIFGLVVYEFCANDDQVNLDLFESARTESWLALAMQDDSTDTIQGTYCQKTGTSGAGTAKRTKTLGAAVDIHTMDDVRLWHKIWVDNGVNVSAIKYRVGNDSSNYYERSSVWTGLDNEDCRNFENFKTNKPDIIVGTVDETIIQRLEIEVVATATIALWNIKFDHSLATQSGITLKNCIRWDKKFVDVRVQYKKPSVLVEDICKLQGFFWFIDYERDLHVFRNNATYAPRQIDDTSLNFDDMSVAVDVSMLKNRQTVRGWEAPATFRYIQDEYCDWHMESWTLDYKPKDLLIYISYQDTPISAITWLSGVATVTTGSAHWLVDWDDVALTDILPNGYDGSYTVFDVAGATFKVNIEGDPGAYVSWGFVGKFQEKTVGIQNLDDPTLYDFLFSFNEKIVTLWQSLTTGKPAKWSVIRRDYFPYQPIRVRLNDSASIASMKAIGGGDGIYDWAVISDSSILSFEDARTRARAELDAYANPQITATFSTEKAGLKAWMIIRIIDATRSLNQDFLIQTIQRKSKKWAISTYNVTCGSTMFWLTEFFQLLLKKSSIMEIDVSELVDIVVNQDETISILPVFVLTKNWQDSFAGSLTKKRFEFRDNVGTRTSGTGRIFHTDKHKNNMRNATISAWMTSTVGFETASRYNTLKGLYINTTAYSGSPTWKSAKATSYSQKALPATQYTFAAWIENLVATGIVGGQWLTIAIKEYAAYAGGSVLQTTNLVLNRNTKQDSKKISTTFTTHASTNYIQIEVTLLESTGKVSIHEMYIDEIGTESVSHAWVADFCEATTT